MGLPGGTALVIRRRGWRGASHLKIRPLVGGGIRGEITVVEDGGGARGGVCGDAAAAVRRRFSCRMRPATYGARAGCCARSSALCRDVWHLRPAVHSARRPLSAAAWHVVRLGFARLSRLEFGTG